MCAAVSIPVAVKIGPYFSAMGEMAARLVTAGARGLVLFNRFYQPDFDLDRMDGGADPRPQLTGRDQAAAALARGAARPPRRVAGGDHRRALARRGRQVHPRGRRRRDVHLGAADARPRAPPHRDGLAAWMDSKGFASVAQIRGAMSQQRVAAPSAFERANYIKILQSWGRIS